MSDTSWVLRGVDPETRDRAVEEAERLGVSVADYLTDMVLRRALSEQVSALSLAPEPAPPQAGDASDFGMRHRLKTLERRLESSTGRLDGDIHALDKALFDVTARVGEVEGLAGDTAHSLQQGLQDLNAQLAVARLHVSDVEDNAAARDEAAERAHDLLSDRVGSVEAVARRAEGNAAALADAHEVLKHAVASDFSAFAQDVGERLELGLRDVTAAADEAASQADAAVAHLVVELRAVRQSLEQSVAEGVDDTRRRIHTVFTEAGAQIAALAQRQDAAENYVRQGFEQVRVQIADVEDAAQSALEETADTLREAGAALAADLQRSVLEGRAALESVHSDVIGEIADLRERQTGMSARMNLIDATASGAAADLAAAREGLQRRIAEKDEAAAAQLAQAQTLWSERLAGLVTRLAALELHNSQAETGLRAEAERIEACTFAALEKLAQDIERGDTGLNARLGRIEGQFSAETRVLQEQHGAFAARIDSVELASSAQAALADRVALLESAAAKAETEQALAIIRAQISDLAREIEANRADPLLPGRLAALEERLGAHAAQADQSARSLSEALARQAAATASGEARLHQAELAISGLQLELKSASEAAAPAAQQAAEIERRVAQFEQRQAAAMDTLRADISRFISENHRRLAALETPAPDYDLAAEFDALRRRVEERILGVEQRSVRTLEQVADTVQMLEQRFRSRLDDAEQQIA
ncbi:MAG: hypothetical protein R3C25_00070 [Hyphomonadaceae bacterium]